MEKSRTFYEKLDSTFSLVFSCYCQFTFLEKRRGSRVLPALNSVFSQEFPNSRSLIFLQLVNQVVYSISLDNDLLPFNL